MTKISEARSYGLTIRESATDGSDFTNPEADYRRLFLGEDGALHLKDSAGAITDISVGGAAAYVLQSLADAKGDLIAATANNTFAKHTAPANGSHLVADSAQSDGWGSILHKYAATVAPAVTNDIDEGYTPGSFWFDTTNDKAYVCLDNTDGAAVWTEITGGGAGGSVATDTIFDAAGDLVQGTGANTAAKLTLGAAGTVVRSTGSTNAYAYPPGYEFAYNEFTSDVSVNQDINTKVTVVTASEVTFDGSTVVCIEFYTHLASPNPTAGDQMVLWLYDGATNLGNIAQLTTPALATNALRMPLSISLVG